MLLYSFQQAEKWKLQSLVRCSHSRSLLACFKSKTKARVSSCHKWAPTWTEKEGSIGISGSSSAWASATEGGAATWTPVPGRPDYRHQAHFSQAIVQPSDGNYFSSPSARPGLQPVGCGWRGLDHVSIHLSHQVSFLLVFNYSDTVALAQSKQIAADPKGNVWKPISEIDSRGFSEDNETGTEILVFWPKVIKYN